MVRRRLPFAPLPGAQVELLRLIHERPGLSVTAAADALQVAPNTVSTLVGSLAAAGLLAREVDAANRRVAKLSLTALARRRIAAYDAIRTGVLEEAMAALEPDERRSIVDALPALRRLVAALERSP